ncbi:MAG TPA: SAM-dependent methyltransferase [Actinomycetospora sp.]|jgi:methyltransferase (TIGR00027 family)|uniref:SAM-dependent methyltransferase n=1 Tax=Actinomycetospora sp. TaxID=1872135 RepID=UPI002F3F563B
MRSEDDKWTITESVGVTALGVASSRAMETRRPDGLVEDPHAEAFLDAVRDEVDLPVEVDPQASSTDPASGLTSTYVGVRSRWFDEHLLDAARDGLDQVVILASGLDTRAQRLPWPAGTTVFEIDQADVVDFKDRVLTETEGSPEPAPDGGVRRVALRVDLRQDWPAALREAGFDPGRPSAWLAEGLLPYLPAQAEVDLFDRIVELSAPGSRIAVEHLADAVDHLDDDELVATSSRRFGVDVRDLVHTDERPDPRERLRAAGWTVEEESAGDAAARYGRPLEGPTARAFTSSVFFEARRP